MKKWLAIPLVVVFGAVCYTSSASAGEPLTLDQAVKTALEDNPDLLASRQRLEIARGRLVKARYWNRFNPEIEGGASARLFDGGGSAVQKGAGLSLEIEVAGQRGKRIQEARRNLARVEAEIADVERGLTAAVKTAFYRVLYLERRLQLVRKVEGLNQRLRDASAERFRSGQVPKLEANLGIIRYSQSRKDTLETERDYRNVLRNLEQLLGREPLGVIDLAGDLKAKETTIDADELVAIALRIRPDLRARKAEVERIEAETALTRRLIMPNPTLSALYDEETETAGSRDRIIGGMISIPLPLFDRQQGELTALAGQRGQAAHKRTATALAVRAEVRDAYRSYEAAKESVNVFVAEAVERIAENFRFIEIAYREGKINLLQLVVVQNDLVAAQFSYLDSLWEYWRARTALERAVGQPLERASEG